MRNVSNTWAVVLAAGEGTRLREITTTEAGEIIPKQFCSLQRETCLLEDAISRAQGKELCGTRAYSRAHCGICSIWCNNVELDITALGLNRFAVGWQG
jgi:hypothetical protein